LGLLNAILTTGIVPTALLEGEIVPLHKSGDVRCLSNYRGITLLSCIYKLLTGLITKRISNICESKGALTAIQGGFRKGQSCLTKIATVQNVLRHAHRHKRTLYVFSSDIRKAFDTAHFDAFNAAFTTLGFDESTVELLDNLQRNFMCEVRTPYGHTDAFQVNAGAKQGCPVSPLKFITLFDVFLKYLTTKGYGYKWPSKPYIPRTPLTMRTEGHITIPGCALADDLIMFSSNRTDFDNMVTALDDFLASAGMAMAPTKCQCISINPSDHDTSDRVTIHDHTGTQLEVPWLPHNLPLKYLGYLKPEQFC
jgi:hypothetical protein